uniref:A-factor biosynthesis hotdog domain-containing protein n=1 Tax=Streptomyces sp. NBC_00003 TaxID=2903608 RepID=A0AAU2V5R4_9ACTN
MSTETFQYAAATAQLPHTAADLSRYSSLTSTVPKELVHRAAVAEVLLTGWRRCAENRFTLSAQWPRGHSFFTAVNGTHYDPLMVAETIRQVGSLIAHVEFDVPLGHQFQMRDLEVAVEPQHLRVEHIPASLELDVTYTETKQRRRGHTAARYQAVVRRDGHVVATGGASYTCVSSEVYERLRGKRAEGDALPALRLTAPVSPQSVGRMSPMDVVLSPLGEPGRWQLRVDTRHPILFDHPVDHIPGMMLIEAARQATAAVLKKASPSAEAFLPVRIVNEFQRYAELHTPCVVEARLLPTGSGDGLVLVSAEQEGERLFTATVAARALHS